MANVLEKLKNRQERKESMSHTDVTYEEGPADYHVKSVSDADPDAPVTHFPAISLRANQYQKDVFAKAAEKKKMTAQEFIRVAALEMARKEGIV